MTLSNLCDANDESVFGGKAKNLSLSLQAGLRVPDGLALSHLFVAELISDNESAWKSLKNAFSKKFGGSVAVRSSAIGEDGHNSSFAGQHLSILNINSYDKLIESIREVSDSVNSDAAKGYRNKIGISDSSVEMAIVIQSLVSADSSGVIFTKNPTSKAREYVIESSWGLGEIVVSGQVIPDYFRIDLDGRILEKRVGVKDIILKLNENGVEEQEVTGSRVSELSLSNAQLTELYTLSQNCQTLFGPDLDIEWCISENKVYLLQCRPITT